MHRTSAGSRRRHQARQGMGSTQSVGTGTARTSPLVPLPRTASRGHRPSRLSNRRSRRHCAIGWSERAQRACHPGAGDRLGAEGHGCQEHPHHGRLRGCGGGIRAQVAELADDVQPIRVARRPRPADARRLRQGRRSAVGIAMPQKSWPEFGRRAVNNAVAWHIDKGALTLSEPRRYRDRAHLRFVSAQPCLICGRRPSDAHHLRFAQPRALGRRVSDEYTVPLCRSHHRALHRHGDEVAWWETNKVDPVAVAQ